MFCFTAGAFLDALAKVAPELSQAVDMRAGTPRRGAGTPSAA
jgi:hypothetical protein